MAKPNREEAIIDRARRLLGAKDRAYPKFASPIRQVDNLSLSALMEFVREKSVVLGDDCAVWNAGGFELLVTTDMLIENTHFIIPSAGPPDSIRNVGFKSVSVNISDIAACGGIPIGFVISLGIPSSATDEEISDFSKGIGKAAKQYGVEVWGGDLVAGREWTICITAIGAVEKGRAVLRKGAIPGFLLVVAGDIGLANAGFYAAYPQAAGLNKSIAPGSDEFPKSRRALHQPVAKIELGRLLGTTGFAAAMIDTSDSIAKSARLLAEASKCGVVLDFAGLKLHSEVTRVVEKLAKSDGSTKRRKKVTQNDYADTLTQFLLDSSEDFNLMFAISRPSFEELRGMTAEKLSIIGEFVKKPGVWIIRNGKPESAVESGFEHFKSKGRKYR